MKTSYKHQERDQNTSTYLLGVKKSTHFDELLIFNLSFLLYKGWKKNPSSYLL